jgi:hypothetical protein
VVEPRARFVLREIVCVPDRQLTRLPLEPTDAHVAGIVAENGGIEFGVAGWYEALLTVDWGSSNRYGTRFSHTAIPDEHPLHSEAIEAGVLVDLSAGKQRLRGNSMFGPPGVDRIDLEVWQDSGLPIDVRDASLEIRPLPDPTG